MWEVTSVSDGKVGNATDQANRLAPEGWEPFAVTVTPAREKTKIAGSTLGRGGAAGVTIWLRRNAQSPNV